jgi:hypothetical protein
MPVRKLDLAIVLAFLFTLYFENSRPSLPRLGGKPPFKKYHETAKWTGDIA